MGKSNCTISFFRNDLLSTRLSIGRCPVKDCSAALQKAPYMRHKGKMRDLPFCSEHGIRIHQNGFVYYNGSSRDDLAISIMRNLMFHSDFYFKHFLDKSNKVESKRLCYENSEDALTYNIFTELLSNGRGLKKLIKCITRSDYRDNAELYLWGGKIDLKRSKFSKYQPLLKVRNLLEPDIAPFVTEPDIILVIPKKVLVCIEAKFGSKNPIAKEGGEEKGEKPKSKAKLIDRYCNRNTIINSDEIFDFSKISRIFYEQLFRNIVFAASMANLAGIEKWYVLNLRSKHIMNVKKGKPESMPVTRNIRSILTRKYKKRFVHLTWEEIYNRCVKGNPDLCNLTWYMKKKTLNCRRAFNIF